MEAGRGCMKRRKGVYIGKKTLEMFAYPGNQYSSAAKRRKEAKGV